MTVLDRAALEGSPLADLHTIAAELSIDGYRRLRKQELIERIIARQTGEEPQAEEPDPEKSGASETDEAGEDSAPGRRRRGRRGGRGRVRDSDGEDAPQSKEEPATKAGSEGELRADRPDRQADREGREEVRGRPGRREQEPETVVEGVVELLANGSGFLRVAPPDASDDDVYISAAQVRRCELVSGDRVSGPRRSPRRSERFASLIRVDTVNGQPAGELAASVRYDDLPAAFPEERYKLGSEDETLKAIEFLAPFGHGSRVAITGESRSGKSRTLRALAEILAGREDLQLFVVLAGVRPEEVADWPADGPLAPAGVLALGASADACDHLVELVVEQARRIAARGTNAVVFIDTLDALHALAARRALAAARNIRSGGSLTVLASASEPLGGETTVIALDARLAAAGREQTLDISRSGTLRAELLVGDVAARAITDARAQALGGAF